MKNIIPLLVLPFIILIGCNQEDELTASLDYDYLYIIHDNADDSIQHKIWQIYQTYKVPVYFNDTVGEIFIKKNLHGDSIFHYETLDLAWEFSSSAKIRYSYEYMTDPTQQMDGLHLVEDFLKSSRKELYPFAILITKSATAKDMNDKMTVYQRGNFKTGFRVLYLSGDWTPAKMKSLPGEITREIIKGKIVNYKDRLTAFNNVSNPSWYEREWWELDDAIDYDFECTLLKESWNNSPDYTPEELETLRADIRKTIGKFGFVSGNKYYGGYNAPQDAEDDLNGYITEILRYPKTTFEAYWGHSPLVMKKYNILYTILDEKFGIKL